LAHRPLVALGQSRPLIPPKRSGSASVLAAAIIVWAVLIAAT
jgi:hypothetical protein